MRGYRVCFSTMLLVFLLAAYPAHAQYWFQSGATASSLSASGNSGASVQIETVLPQSITSGSVAFWVGEDLPNGAFLQIGYSIYNETGNVPSDCTQSGCSSSQFVKAGDAEWFFEYFPADRNNSFYGSVGPDGSAGPDGAFNTYSFYSQGNTWYFEVNGTVVGSANLGTSTSGPYTPSAMGEMANTSTNSAYMVPVIFANLSAYKDDEFLPAQSAYGTVSYGVGSETRLPNPYGVKEVDSRVNYFEVGSGLPTSNNNTQLWSLGYRLRIVSPYGGIASSNEYLAYASTSISAPGRVSIGPGAIAIFKGWTGKGAGSYTGTSPTEPLLMSSNITETASWEVEYFVNVSSQYGTASGTGWYQNGTTAAYGIINTTFIKEGKTFRFSGWSNGNANYTGVQEVTAPINITADWQYGVQLSGRDAYGNSIPISYVIIDGSTVNATTFLNANSVSRLTGVYYRGQLLAATQNITQNSTPQISLPLPVYNIDIKATGILSMVPVNALATISFENGSSETAYTGASGTITIPDVAYGYANVTLSYLGQTMQRSASGGSGVAFVFVSLPDLAVVALVFAIAIVVVLLLARRIRSSNRQYGQQ